MSKKIHNNPNLYLRVLSISEYYKQRTFKIFMDDSQAGLFAKVAQNIQPEIIRSTDKEIPRINRPIDIKYPRKAILRDPVKFKLGSISGIENLICLLTGEIISKGEECIIFIVSAEDQGYIISAAIKNVEDFNELIKIGSIYEYFKLKNA